MLAHFEWQRNINNPVLPPEPDSSYDSTCCMNPFAIEVNGETWLYYAGADDDGVRRICLAIASAEEPTNFKRHGVVLDIGKAGAFDAKWCVLPTVFRFGDKLHLYYSGHEGSDLGLQSFPGIGLAISDDGKKFKRVSSNPVITGSQSYILHHQTG